MEPSSPTVPQNTILISHIFNNCREFKRRQVDRFYLDCRPIIPLHLLEQSLHCEAYQENSQGGDGSAHSSSVGGPFSWSHLSSSSSGTWLPSPSAQMACLEPWVRPHTPSQVLKSGGSGVIPSSLHLQHSPETIQSAASQGVSLLHGSSMAGLLLGQSPSSNTSIVPSSIFL